MGIEFQSMMIIFCRYLSGNLIMPSYNYHVRGSGRHKTTTEKAGR